MLKIRALIIKNTCKSIKYIVNIRYLLVGLACFSILRNTFTGSFLQTVTSVNVIYTIYLPIFKIKKNFFALWFILLNKN